MLLLLMMYVFFMLLEHYLTSYQSYRELKGTPDQLYTWELFLGQVTLRDLFSRLEKATIVVRGLPRKTDLQKPSIASTFSDVLRNGSISRSDSTTGEDAPALGECFRNGWLHADKSPESPDGTVYPIRQYSSACAQSYCRVFSTLTLRRTKNRPRMHSATTGGPISRRILP